MLVAINTSGLKQTRWYEFATRFALGGLVTAGAAQITDKLGPSFGGLFLAFPAILAASVTLVEKHEREGKEKKGLHGVIRGGQAAAADAAGAAMGSLGLVSFACFVAIFIPNHNPALVIVGATVVWALVSSGVWFARKKKLCRRFRFKTGKLSGTAGP
ncbi:MAG TPA: DUF3147 family protein [Terriglobales bacterium]|nr:DUF3147 family protein [Terriglobales bacterium]